jgi:hypothetical protein
MSAVAAVTSAANTIDHDARWRRLANVADWMSVVAFADSTDPQTPILSVFGWTNGKDS